MHVKPNIFPVIVVMRGTPGSPFLGVGLDREVHRIDPAHRTTLRFERNKFDLWVTNADETEQILTLQMAHAHVTSMSETEVTIDGVEVSEFKMTGHAMQVVLTNKGSGWAPEDAED